MEAIEIYRKENAQLKEINEGLKKQLKRTHPETMLEAAAEGVRLANVELHKKIKKLKKELKKPDNYKEGFYAAIKKVLAVRKKNGSFTIAGIEKLKP